MNKLMERATAGFLKRLQDACDMVMILLDLTGDPDTDKYIRKKVFMLCLKKGVSCTWLLHGRGLFWEKHNKINCN